MDKKSFRFKNQLKQKVILMTEYLNVTCSTKFVLYVSDVWFSKSTTIKLE